MFTTIVFLSLLLFNDRSLCRSYFDELFFGSYARTDKVNVSFSSVLRRSGSKAIITQNGCETNMVPDIGIQFSFHAVTLLNADFKNIDSTVITSRQIFPKGTLLSIKQSNSNNTLIYLFYSLDGAKEQSYFESISLPAKGTHQICIRAVDSLGCEYYFKPFIFRIVD